MKNIFAKFQDYVKKPNRNTFDLSFYNNLTLKFGQLTPVFCKEVIPGDSFRINTAFGLQLMPMKFPVQTPMRAYVHYFYVRNRTLWKDWMDFICGTKDNLVLPWVDPVDKKAFFRVGGIADYFGVPNVIYGSYGFDSNSEVQYTRNFRSGTLTIDDVSVIVRIGGVNNIVKNAYIPYLSPSYYDATSTSVKSYAIPAVNSTLTSAIVGQNLSDILEEVPATSAVGDYIATVASINSDFDMSATGYSARNKFKYLAYQVVAECDLPSSISTNQEYSFKLQYPVLANNANPSISPEGYFLFVDASDNVLGIINAHTNEGGNHFVYEPRGTSPYYSSTYTFTMPLMNATPVKMLMVTPNLPNSSTNWTGDNPEYSIVSQINRKIYGTFEVGSVSADGGRIIYDDLDASPFENQIHLNALPFRAYEAIYNAYYRNPQNNPFVLSGTPEYNRYNTTYEGGQDTTQYELYQRNWEYDFLTSAVQSPQQGVAPLVGMSVTGEATFQDDDGNTYYAQAILNDQGEITGWQSHSSNMPTGSLRLLMDMAGSGISINDLRNVNAFQRFLENNIRRGLKYRDQLMSHFGVKARYDELDMPEFIGGCSTSINVNKLSQTSESGDTPLGSFVGQASAFGQSKHSITHYCDEHGFIIGIMSVVPVPVYSQLLPKFFVKSQQLDYYFPEFGHIGYQPIQQKEVSPLQTYFSGNDLNKVFGYNRAWYDYLASIDEVHAQFRTTMRDFLMNRTFDSEPELSEEFLLVDPDQLNDVFLAGTDDNDLYAPESDKIIGSIYFDVSAKRPIPLFGIPKLIE